MLELARKALSSRLAKATFTASIPKMMPDQVTFLATTFRRIIEDGSVSTQARSIFEELLAMLPAGAKTV